MQPSLVAIRDFSENNDSFVFLLLQICYATFSKTSSSRIIFSQEIHNRKVENI